MEEDAYYNRLPSPAESSRVLGAYRQMFGENFQSKLRDPSAGAAVSAKIEKEKEEEELRNRGIYLRERFGANSEMYRNHLSMLKAMGVSESGSRERF